MSALDDRRQAALEAGQDAVADHEPFLALGALETAIETATRVRITEEIITAHGNARAALNQEQMHGRPPATREALTRAGLAAAFRAAGLEVEE